MKENLLRATAELAPQDVVSIQAKDLRQVGFPVPAGTPDLRPVEVGVGELRQALEDE